MQKKKKNQKTIYHNPIYHVHIYVISHIPK